MNRFFCVFILFAILAGCGGGSNNEKSGQPQAAATPAAAPAAAPDDAMWVVSEGIAAPESVYVDSDSGFIFVSNINGMPDQRDGNGYISKLSADGKMVTAQWVTGFNAPKGLRSYK